jgi:hypothetical protein
MELKKRGYILNSKWAEIYRDVWNLFYIYSLNGYFISMTCYSIRLNTSAGIFLKNYVMKHKVLKDEISFEWR